MQLEGNELAGSFLAGAASSGHGSPMASLGRVDASAKPAKENGNSATRW